MSLTTFIAEPDVKAWLKANFPFHAPKLPQLICSEPHSRRFALIGTAFDYLLRFRLQQIYPYAVAKQWIAEYLGEEVEMAMEFAGEDESEEGIPVIGLDFDTVKSVWHAIKQARINHAAYLASGIITDDLLRSAIHLAQMDSWYRAGVLGIPFGNIDEEDVKDLRNLWDMVPVNLLYAERVCLLNPTFGSSALVGGADVDIVLDDKLIDIKTTKFLKITRDYINQLIGYYILHRIGGLIGAPSEHQINTIGIYFSRHGYLHTWPITDFINEINYPDLQQWFELRAKRNARRHY